MQRKPTTDMPPRFDDAHGASIAATPPAHEPSPVLLAATAGIAGSGTEQLQLQANELAEHLQQRQRELARREAILNARSATYDDQQRTARLWFQERQSDLDAQQAELEQQREALRDQAAAIEAAKQTASALQLEKVRLEQSRSQLEEQRAQLRIELEDVQQQANWLESARASLRAQRADEQHTLAQMRAQLQQQRRTTEELNARLRERISQVQDVSSRSDELETWRQQLEVQASQLHDQRVACERQQQAAVHERELWRTRTAQQRQAIAALWHRRRLALQKQRETLRQRQQTVHEQQQTLERQQEALRQACHELTQRQLVVQQAEATLRLNLLPSDLRHIEHAVRDYVAQHLDQADQTLADRKRELQGLTASLAAQQETLQKLHARLQTQWSIKCQQLESRLQQLEQCEQALAGREPR